MEIRDKLWDDLLKLKERFTLLGELPRYVSYSNRGFQYFEGVEELPHESADFIFSSDSIDLTNWTEEVVHPDGIFFNYPSGSSKCPLAIRLYAPLCLLRWLNMDRAFLISHFAQTLDGKIATDTGASQWIGNKANLTHAHRIRALVDAVMVGGKTLIADKPTLNVRHVKGTDPKRIFLTNTFSDFESIIPNENAETLLIRSQRFHNGEEFPNITRTIAYNGKEDWIHPELLLRKLKEENIHSVILEGGPSTLSSFMAEKCIDLIQLHIAPIIFGSGKACISLNSISEVSESRDLQNVSYLPMGDAIMLTANLK